MNIELRYSPKLRRELWWPKDDTNCWSYLTKKAARELPKRVSELCKNKKVVLQAGGNAGLYPLIYGEIFKTVYTFEPESTNYECLMRNVQHRTNINYSNQALGSEFGRTSLKINDPTAKKLNYGTFHVVDEQDETNTVDIITVDSLKIKVDLIHFDLEGFEGPALVGAKSTIIRSKPLIVLETNGSGDSYGWPQERIDNFLYSLGYKEIEKGHDTIYEYQG